MSDDDFYQQLQEATSKPISDESLEAAQKALQESSNQTLVDSIKEIQQLVSDGNALDTRLLSAYHLIQKANLSSASKMNDLRDAYVKLLWDSRGIAGSAKGAADDFGGDMLDLIRMEDVSASDKILELESWKKLTLAKGQAAIDQPQQFQNFDTQLRAYADEAEQEIGDQQSEAKEQLEKFRAQIKDLDQQIESIVVNVVTPIVEFLKIGAGAFGSILTGSPLSAFTALLKAIASGVVELKRFEKELKEADEKRRELMAQRDAVQEQVRQLEVQQEKLGDASTVPPSLRSIADAIDDFSKRMTPFTNIFTQLINEANDIIGFLKNDTPLSDPIFSSKLDLVKGLVDVDSRILHIYSSAPTSND
ncbi:hypothetical protein K474DRAFT_127820 [Panus rudis PR-1116 ss-1]|nr:hypothetical protein K474DRAFT_127820 [Panus rudis PR-1116 ss-1]